jgi:hypothetical protein
MRTTAYLLSERRIIDLPNGKNNILIQRETDDDLPNENNDIPTQRETDEDLP